MLDKADHTTETTMYFESIENSDNVNEEYEKSDVSIPLTENTVIGKWDCEINNTHSLQVCLEMLAFYLVLMCLKISKNLYKISLYMTSLVTFNELYV